MPQDFEYIETLDSTINRAILISERSEQLFLLAIDFLKEQSQWSINDTDFDEVEGWIAEAETQLLEPMESGGGTMNIETKDVSRNSVFTITGSQTNYAVLWNVGDYDSSDNSRIYVENTARFILTCNIDIDSAGGNRLEPEIFVNGAFYCGLIHAGATNQSYALSTTIDLSADSYVQLKVSTNGNANIVVNAWSPRLALTGFYDE